MARTSVFVAVAVLLACALCASAQTNSIMDCTYSDSSGDYDLSDMIITIYSNTTKANLYSGVDVNGATYYSNICNLVTPDTNCAASTSTPTCQVNAQTPTTGTPCGLLSTQSFSSGNDTWASDGGVKITYTDGQGCDVSKGNHPNRTSIFHIACVSGANSLSMKSVEEDGCWYEIYIDSEFACPSGGGAAVDPGWIIIFLVCLMYLAYVVIGMIIKFVKFEGRGIDMVPNLDFWKDIPFLIRDACVFTVQKVSMGKLCAGYNSI